MSSLPVPLPAEVASRLFRAADLPRRGASLRADDRLATGVAPLDALLDGGLPRGTLVELTGRSGGRFALVLATLAAATSRGEPAALLDLGDNLDPSSAEEAGCDLARLLWVRPQRFRDALLAAETVAAAGFRLVVLDAGLALPSSRLRDAAPWLRPLPRRRLRARLPPQGPRRPPGRSPAPRALPPRRPARRAAPPGARPGAGRRLASAPHRPRPVPPHHTCASPPFRGSRFPGPHRCLRVRT